MTLVVYVEIISATKPDMSQVNIPVAKILIYLKGLIFMICRFYNVFGQPYGYCSIAPSTSTYFFGIAVAVIVGLSIFKMRILRLPVAPGMVTLLSIASVAVLISSTISPLYGAATGFRIAVEPRYVYTPGLIIAIIFPLILWIVTRGTAVFKLISWLLISYSSFLTIYSLNDIWGTQKEIDNRIGQQIDSRLTPAIEAIVTDNGVPDRLGLTPHHLSDAISDFQVDWGIGGRIKVTNNQKLFISKNARLLENGKIELNGYWGGTKQVESNKIMFLVYRYENRFSNLPDAELHIFTNYNDYMKFKENESDKRNPDTP